MKSFKIFKANRAALFSRLLVKNYFSSLCKASQLFLSVDGCNILICLTPPPQMPAACRPTLNGSVSWYLCSLLMGASRWGWVRGGCASETWCFLEEEGVGTMSLCTPHTPWMPPLYVSKCCPQNPICSLLRLGCLCRQRKAILGLVFRS